MLRVALLSLSVLIVILLSGCDTGFKVVDGKAAYVTWDESNGRLVHYGESADAKTFQPIDHDRTARVIYARDARHVFVVVGNPLIVEAADPASFTILTRDGLYAKDNDRVFLRC